MQGSTPEERVLCENCGAKTVRLIAAERMADTIAAAVVHGILDSRSGPADALLVYRDPPRTERSNQLVDVLRRAERAEAKVEELKNQLRQISS